MIAWSEWFSIHWTEVFYPLIAFLATYVAGIWIRIYLYRFFSRQTTWNRWRGSKITLETLRRPILDWFLILGATIAVRISVLSGDLKHLAGQILASLFVISLAWTAMQLSEKLIRLYSESSNLPPRPISISVNVIRITIIIIGLLVILDLWGAPVNPILLAIAVIIFVAVIALRDAIPSYITGFQIHSGRQIKVGDFIRLETGEAGQVTAITWQQTHIQSLDGDHIIIPNSKLARTTVVNYGRPLKKALDPFHFYTRLHLRELTGQKASNLTELLNILKNVGDSVIYYHSHHFLEEHLALSPEPTNDFAIWVNTALGNDVLAEQLASIDTFRFPNLTVLKQRLVEVLENYLKDHPDDRRCPEGEEFYFIRSISFILPTPFVAHDLREFVEILRKVTIDSIYFHIFEARLRLQRGSNDFSIWITDSLGEKELADKIAEIDPYVYTLENLRNRIIELAEAYVK